MIALLVYALPFSKAYLGVWEGPAVLHGRRHGRLRLDFATDGTISLGEISREKDGRLHRDVYEGKAHKVCGDIAFDYLGVAKDVGNPQGAVASEAGTWTLTRLRIKGGVLSGRAYLNEPGDAHRFLLRRRKG